MQTSQSKVIKWAIIIGIIVTLNLFFNYSLSLIFSHHDYEYFCKSSQVNIAPTTQKSCVDAGGQWNENTYPAKISPTETAPQVVGYCDTMFTCNQNFQNDSKAYEKNVFISLIILGIISIVIGVFLKTAEPVMVGLSLGGVLSLIAASIRYWSYAENLLKVALLGVALVALIWVAVKKFQQ